MASDPGPGYGLPPPNTGNFLLNWIAARPPRLHPGAPHRPVHPPGLQPVPPRPGRPAGHRIKNMQREGRTAGLAEERKQPDEEDHLDDIIETFKAQMRGLWNPGHFERGGNTKTHGIVRAEFIVRDDLPEHMRRGIYAEPRTYRAWVRFSGPRPVHHARHRRRRLHEHEHQADGRARAEAAGRRAAHAGHDGRLDADLRHAGHGANAQLQHWSLRNAAVFYFLNSARPHILDSIMQLLWTKTQTSPLESEYFSCVPYLLGEGQAMQYSFRHAAEDADARAAAAAAAAGQLPPRRDGRDARRAGRRVRHLAPGADRSVPDADREQRACCGRPGCRRACRRPCCGSRSRRSTRPSSSRSPACSRTTRGTPSPSTARSGNQSRARKRMY